MNENLILHHYMATEYYLIIDEKQNGPFAYEELVEKGLNPDMLVWRAGLPDWTKASLLPELSVLMNSADPYARRNMNGNEHQGDYGSNSADPQYDRNQYGPNNPGEGGAFGNNPQYSQRPDFSRNPQYNTQYGQQQGYGQNPQYGQQPGYGHNPKYGQQTGY